MKKVIISVLLAFLLVILNLMQLRDQRPGSPSEQNHNRSAEAVNPKAW